uniref:Uncharacterized protein n=1 Tax=Megaselia scalaris TaxID=36166 RepID=T1H4C0_MEGSC
MKGESVYLRIAFEVTCPMSCLSSFELKYHQIYAKPIDGETSYNHHIPCIIQSNLHLECWTFAECLLTGDPIDGETSYNHLI